MDPKQVHNADQQIATWRTMATGIAVFYAELIERKVPVDLADRLTIEYLRGLQDSVRRPQPPRAEE